MENLINVTKQLQDIFLKNGVLEFSRSSRPVVFCKKGVLENFAKFTGKHLYQSLFFNKVADLRPVTFLKKRLRHRCFPVNFANFLRTPIFIEHLWWMLLIFQNWAYNKWNFEVKLGFFKSISMPCGKHYRMLYYWGALYSYCKNFRSSVM